MTKEHEGFIVELVHRWYDAVAVLAAEMIHFLQMFF